MKLSISTYLFQRASHPLVPPTNQPTASKYLKFLIPSPIIIFKNNLISIVIIRKWTFHEIRFFFCFPFDGVNLLCVNVI